MKAFLLSAIISAAVSFTFFDLRYASRRVAQWTMMRDQWRAFHDVVALFGQTDRQTRASAHIDYCERHIAFWQQNFWSRMLWRHYPSEVDPNDH